MIRFHSKFMLAAIIALPVGAFATTSAVAESMTSATTDLLKVLKLPESILSGLDKELKVPAAWTAGSKKEGKLRVRLTMHAVRFEKVRKVFEARYPWIKIEYTRGIGQKRALGPLLAFKRGTFVTDIVSSFSVLEKEYIKADAAMDLRMLPNIDKPRGGFHSPAGIGIGYRVQHWCVAYGKKKVKVADLPKTWDDILTNPRWRKGNLGIAINANVWLAPLWVSQGEAWSKNYMEKLFNVVKPQIRKERLSTTPKLAALGEFDLTIPAGDFIVKGLVKEGVPVGFHCPDPVPIGSAWVGVLKGSPNTNSALIFANWLLSKEGQLANHHGDAFIPIHKDLQQARFLPYPEAIAGKKLAILGPPVMKEMPTVIKLWHAHWLKSGGTVGRGKKGKRRKRQPR